MMFGLLGLAAAASIHGAPHTGPQSGRDDLLVSSAPYPAHRTDSPARVENGRLWVSRLPIGSRTPIAEQIVGDPGPGAYGAPWHEVDDVVFVRVNNVTIAINPWERLDVYGSQNDLFFKLERARTQWLREQGYVLKVRTHVNPRFHAGKGSMYTALPTPRATIRVNDELPRRPSKLRVMETDLD